MSYYVKLDNILADESKRGFTRFDAVSGPELLEKAREFFGWRAKPNVSLQLWTTLDGRKIRVDNMPVLSEPYQFIYLKACTKSW